MLHVHPDRSQIRLDEISQSRLCNSTPAHWTVTAQFLICQSASLKHSALADARAAQRGLMVLPGTGLRPVLVGDPIQWLANPTGSKEYTWTLHRLEHWSTLLRAHLLQPGAGFGAKVVDELRHWLQHCPRPDPQGRDAAHVFNRSDTARWIRSAARGLERFPALLHSAQNLRYGAQALKRWTHLPNGKRSTHADAWRLMEVGTRMFDAWPLVQAFLTELAPSDRELAARLAQSALEHGEVLAEISPQVWPDAGHNHYLQECLGLLALALHFPHLPHSGAWTSQAMSEIERCARAQWTEDGGHIEGCPHYHNWCFYFFCRAKLLAQRHGLRFSDHFDHCLRRAANYVLHTLRPTGRSVPWGDSDADDSAIKAALFAYLCFADIDWLRRVRDLCGHERVLQECWQQLWHLPDAPRLIDDLESPSRPCPAHISLPRVLHQRELKQVMLRTDWSANAISAFFACRSPVYNAHAHIDPLAFDLTAFGQEWLVDPGRFTYEDTLWRRRFKSASWHNTLTIDRREPFSYVSSWRFGRQSPGQITAVYDQPRVLAAEGQHENYAPVLHRRLLAVIDGFCVLVLDQVTHLRHRQSVQLYYHLNSTSVFTQPADRAVLCRCNSHRLLLRVTPSLDTVILPGRISHVRDQFVPSRRLRFEQRRGDATRTYATLIVPVPLQSAMPETALQLDCRSAEVVCDLAVDRRQWRVLWQPELSGSMRAEPWRDNRVSNLLR
jgi:hypothetical protein